MPAAPAVETDLWECVLVDEAEGVEVEVELVADKVEEMDLAEVEEMEADIEVEIGMLEVVTGEVVAAETGVIAAGEPNVVLYGEVPVPKKSLSPFVPNETGSPAVTTTDPGDNVLPSSKTSPTPDVA